MVVALNNVIVGLITLVGTGGDSKIVSMTTIWVWFSGKICICMVCLVSEKYKEQWLIFTMSMGLQKKKKKKKKKERKRKRVA